MTYERFFHELTGCTPFPYQVQLSQGPWPHIVDVPTGLGKTAAVLVAYLYRLLQGDALTGRRLVYCLPMRVLVEQTVQTAELLTAKAREAFEARHLQVPSVHAMLGGYVDEEWEGRPDAPAILVGTQDMLVSRALARGYGMSRYKWPLHFAWLHNDWLWVLDETQLMGVAVETSAQLAAFRDRFGTLGPAHTVWMSATLARDQIVTVDHPAPPGGFRVVALGPEDRKVEAVEKRTRASKPLTRAGITLSGKNQEDYAEAVAALAAEAHTQRGELTLVVVNQVARAQAVYRALRARGLEPIALIHSRFRAGDRTRHHALLMERGHRVVVATQVVEAGVDVSARTLITELAPWPSFVQRLGRCNRYGDDDSSRVLWLDVDVDEDEKLARPYDTAEMRQARRLLEGLSDGSPELLASVPYSAPRVIRPVLRARDLLDFFDTTPDLLGNDVDVSRFVRDGDDTDVLVYWRVFDGAPDAATTMPAREEIVRVPVGLARDFLGRLEAKRRALGDSDRDRERREWLTPWTPNSLGTQTPWTLAVSVHPGQVILLHAAAGGYDPELGWTGDVLPGQPVETVAPGTTGSAVSELMDSDPRSNVGRWIPLAQHLASVAREARRLAEELHLPRHFQEAIETAARWHDVGKAHDEFQRRLVEPVSADPTLAPPGNGPWAKSAHDRRPSQESRPYFRHELASALAWLQLGPDGPYRDLVAYLIAAHHGKVRLSIRSVAGERRPPEGGRLFARGIWHGDPLPVVDLGEGLKVGPVELDLSPMQLGEGSWLERSLALRDDRALGPFRLAFLESLVRIADWRASEQERHDA